ncbi:MAG: nitroreductase family deazaflavin-dependent oxidoreductase [Anaerolineae bacterium]
MTTIEESRDRPEIMPYPESGLLKAFFRSPILGWRLGLGRILGHEFVLITTWGRRSGKPRRAVTEYHTLRGKIYVPSAYGAKADWYRNLAQDPHVTVQTWQGPESLVAHRVTDDEELRAVYHLFRRTNRPMMDWYLSSLGIDPEDPDDYVAKKDRVYIVRFDPTGEETPPPLEADLVWVWPVVAGLLLGVWLATRLLRPKDDAA